MATTVETYMDSQQMCDYALLKHVNIGKEIADEKLYKVCIYMYLLKLRDFFFAV